MPLDSLLSHGAVIPALKATSKKLLFQELARASTDLCGVDERTIFEALLEREDLGATSVGEGVAIPHARLPDIDKIYGFFARLVEPIDFGADDGEMVDLVFMLLAPEAANAMHLRALAKISRTFKQPEFRANLRGADGAEALYMMLTERHVRAA